MIITYFLVEQSGTFKDSVKVREKFPFCLNRAEQSSQPSMGVFGAATRQELALSKKWLNIMRPRPASLAMHLVSTKL